jgi:catechol 2,3-dioxygenase-like lactoylglutathione lyase family enzyme
MPPTKLAHLVFQTNRLKDMRDWYCSVLGGRVVYEDPHLSFVTTTTSTIASRSWTSVP